MESTAEAVTIDNAGEKGEKGAAVDRSTIKFPYLDQDDSVAIAKKVFELGGKSCDKIALAAALDVSADGGAFGLRLATAKMFGFVTTEKKTISLTDLGQRVVDPETEKAARAESFLAVPLYEKLYEDYQGQLLPGNDGLEAHLVKVGVAPKQKDKARQVFQRSARQAGFFAISNNRLVAPQFKPGDNPPAEGDKGDAGGNGKGGTPPPPPPPKGPELPPHVQLLIGKLPKEGETVWGMTGRKKWLEAALKIFDLIYETDGDDAELVISFKDSAN